MLFSYIRRLGPFFWVQSFEFHFCGVFRKKLEYEEICDILGHHQKLDYFFFFFWGGGVISIHFSSFFIKVKVQSGNIVR